MELKECPKCKGKYSKYPAISRADNKTEICSRCGIAEALVNCLFPKIKLHPTKRSDIEIDLRNKVELYGNENREKLKSSRKVANNSEKRAN